MASARMARNEGAARAAREMRSTVPADLPPSQRTWLSDRPSWCVDRGETLVAMTTCDLWLALAKGDVGPKTKVWREGMPWWDAVESVPEFALAMPDASVWGPGPVSGTRPVAPAALGREVAAAAAKAGAAAVEARAEVAAAARELERAESAMKAVESVSAHGREDDREWPSLAAGAGDLSMDPLSDGLTPAPVVVDDAPPKLRRRPVRGVWSRIDRKGAMSVAIGALLAVVALTIATATPVKPPVAEPPSTTGTRSNAAAAQPVDAPSTDAPTLLEAMQRPRGSPASTAATTTATAATTARAPRGPHASDRGQHRAR